MTQEESDTVLSGDLPSPELVRQIMRHIERSDVEEIDLSWGGTRIKVKQEPAPARTRPMIDRVDAEPEGLPINAPLTGVYYARPSPEQPPFVSPGDSISLGQVVALIETMKLFNEVVSEVNGVVLELVAKEGEVVERDRPLMRVDVTEGAEQPGQIEEAIV